MATVAYGYRVLGLTIGTLLGESGRLRRLLDILPACAIGAVLGPALPEMTLPQSIALVGAAAFFVGTSRFLLALTLGTAILLSESWILQHLS